MKNNIMYLILSFAMVSALTLASCQPAPNPESGGGQTVTGAVTSETTKTQEAAPTQTSTSPIETTKKPQYGGTLNIIGIIATVNPVTWDPADAIPSVDYNTSPYQENLLFGDLSRGPRGTNEFSFNFTYWIPDELTTGCLAENWEQPDPLTVIFTIRKGVQFPSKAGVMASRELTAKDVEFSLNRLFTSPKLPKGRFDYVQSLTATDKYHVTLKMSKYNSNWMAMLAWGAAYVKIYPPELVTAGIADWRNAVGTGPFILMDYVASASLTYVKNPIYWGKTTIDGKEYQLPFVDKLMLPIIPDYSTQLAALRTGKADIQEAVSWQDTKSLAQTSPQLKQFRYLQPSAFCLVLRMDTPPFNDIRVRKALSMAVDRQAYLDSQLGGAGVFLSFPLSAAWPRSIYTPLEEMPDSVKEMFTYNPEKARALLNEAGFPNGFSVETVTWSGASYLDFASLVASYMEKIGVTLNIKSYETAAFQGIVTARNYKTAASSQANSNPSAVLRSRVVPTDPYNYSMFNDAKAIDMVNKFQETTSSAEQYRIMKELNVYFLEQAPLVIFPTGYTYKYAWPWVMNYFGEHEVGYLNVAPVYARLWIDQELKQNKK